MGQHSLNYPPSFLFRYLERLVRSLLYLPFIIFRGMEDESGDQFVAYFLPSDETLEKRSNESKGKEPAEDEEWVNIPIFILQHCIATRGYFKKFTGNWNCLYKMRLYIISVESIGIVSTIHNFWNFSLILLGTNTSWHVNTIGMWRTKPSKDLRSAI